MPTNDFLAFATGGSANVEDQADYLIDPLLPTGNEPGVAVSAFNNKALRQACWIAHVLSQFIVNTSGLSMLDDANLTNALAAMTATWPNALTPTLTKLTATGATAGYLFTCSTANATVGAVYANNSNNYTVLSTLASGTLLFCSGASAPLSSGTLTKQSGTGDSTIAFSANVALATYTTPANCKYLKIKMVGGGGGGAAGGSTTASGGAGGMSAFGANLLLAGGGGGATFNDIGGVGGTVLLNSPAIGTAFVGGAGAGSSYGNGSAAEIGGNSGASTPFGGAGAGGRYIGNGGAAVANTGSGGGGAGAAASGTKSGSAGGAGGFIDAIIGSPSATYYYCVATAGAASSGGDNTSGAGATGVILVEEHYGN